MCNIADLSVNRELDYWQMVSHPLFIWANMFDGLFIYFFLDILLVFRNWKFKESLLWMIYDLIGASWLKCKRVRNVRDWRRKRFTNIENNTWTQYVLANTWDWKNHKGVFYSSVSQPFVERGTLEHLYLFLRNPLALKCEIFNFSSKYQHHATFKASKQWIFANLQNGAYLAQIEQS